MDCAKVNIKTVFDDVLVDSREFYGDELADLLINDVELVVVVSGEDFGFEFRNSPRIQRSSG